MAQVTLNDFNNFLNEHHIFSEYWREFHKARIAGRAEVPNGNPDVAYQRFLSLNPIRWISAAFPWVGATEGFAFWSYIDNAWCVFVKKAYARKQFKK